MPPMLLLISSDLWGKPRRIRLSELFLMKQGMAVQTKKNAANQKGKYKYKVVYPSDLNDPLKELQTEQLADYFTDKEIKEEKILTKEDYILFCKGMVKGLSMFNSENSLIEIAKSGYKGIIASNHFIVLRPDSSIKEHFPSPYYLENIIDLVIPMMNEMIKNANYITISEIGKISIELPLPPLEKDLKKFEDIFKLWRDNRDLFIEAEKKLKIYNEAFAKQLKVELS